MSVFGKVQEVKMPPWEEQSPLKKVEIYSRVSREALHKCQHFFEQQLGEESFPSEASVVARVITFVEDNLAILVGVENAGLIKETLRIKGLLKTMHKDLGLRVPGHLASSVAERALELEKEFNEVYPNFDEEMKKGGESSGKGSEMVRPAPGKV